MHLFDGVSVQAMILFCTLMIIVALCILKYLVTEEMVTNINKQSVYLQFLIVCVGVPLFIFVASLPVIYLVNYLWDLGWL